MTFKLTQYVHYARAELCFITSFTTFFLLLTSTYIPYVVIIFSHYTFCVTFNMLLY